MLATPSSGHKDGETYYKTQLEVLNKERKALQERLEIVERENRDLKRAVYELTSGAGYVATGAQGTFKNTLAFDLDNVLNDSYSASEKTREEEEGAAQNRINFACKIDLSSHAGAVYSISFSPCGRFLASASFDKSVRAWSVENPSDGPVTSIYSAHDANVVDVAWSSDSTLVFSGGYDRFVKEWDVVTYRDAPLSSYPCPGLVQSIAISHLDDMIFAATTADTVICFDRRAPGGEEENAGIIRNDCMVNTITLSNDGTTLISGDRRGAIKTWDVRKMGAEPISTTPNGSEKRPISHIHANPAFPGEDEGRLLAVNSYDNYLRVYDRGERLLGGSPSALRMMHVLRGHRNRNWPIRSSFFCGKEYRPWRSAGGGTTVPHEAEDFEFTMEEEVEKRRSSPGISGSLLLATGSADGNVYLFDISGGTGTAKNVQILHGHQDRCYAVAFHPKEPILASCSSDSLVKLWTPAKTANATSS